MTKKELNKCKTIYYSDLLNDDFSETKLKRIPVPKNYQYIRKNKFSLFFQNIFYHFIAIPILWCVSIFSGVKVKNRKALKQLKHLDTGVFFYGNHVSDLDVFKIQTMCVFRRCNIIGYTDALSIGKFIKPILKALGFLPLPLADDLRNLKELQEAIDYDIHHKEHVIIYPEAHIWPYYTLIRPFKNGSFHYPAKYKAPILPFVTVYRKVWWSKKPKESIVIGKLVYPKEDLDLHRNRDYLREECYNQMVDLMKNNNEVIYKQYVYQPKETENNRKSN